MSEFTEHYATLDARQRKQVRKDLEAELVRLLQLERGHLSKAQIRATARKMVDMSMAAARKESRTEANA